MFDVTVSTWNKFWSFQLIHGLTERGYKVNALGTTRRKPDAGNYECCWPAAIATQLGHRFPAKREELFAFAIERYERFATSHVHDTRCFWGWSGHHLAAFEKAKKLDIPVILETGSTHGLAAKQIIKDEYTRHGLATQDSLLDRFISKMLREYEIADWICVPSHFVANTFVARGIPESKIHINPYGADIAFWNQCCRESRINSSPFIFIYAAQIMLRKGVAYLMEAWKKLGKTNLELWLIGGVHPDCAALMEELPCGVRLFGHKNHSELRELYARADVFLLPSLEEGLARSVLEAMAAGLPVIITEETGATDVMLSGEDGWVIPSRNVEALAAVLHEASSDQEEAASRGRSARRRVAAYGWNAYGLRAANFFSRALGTT